MGLSDSQMAVALDVSVVTLNAWKKKDAFLKALSAGKAIADERVENALYHRACGYSHPEDKIFNANGVALVVPTIKHYPPDTEAAKFWLVNRQKERWANKQAVELSGEVKHDLAPALEEKLSAVYGATERA
jgi:hypothetical protein